MRVPAETIRQEGKRLSIYSKFYIWKDILFEPAIYRGKPTQSYKSVNDSYRVREALARVKESIPKVSLVCPSFNQTTNNKSTFKHNRYAILDL
jgi:hypothetical protein